MSFFDSDLREEPVVGKDGNAYGVVSSKCYNGTRYYEVVRVTPEGEVQRARDPHNPHEPGNNPLRFPDERGAVKAKVSLAFSRPPYPPASYYFWY